MASKDLVLVSLLAIVNVVQLSLAATDNMVLAQVSVGMAYMDLDQVSLIVVDSMDLLLVSFLVMANMDQVTLLATDKMAMALVCPLPLANVGLD